MNKALWIVIILGGVLLISEVLLWLSMSSSGGSKSEIIDVNEPLEFYFVSYTNNVRLIGMNAVEQVRGLLKNYYRSKDQIVGYVDEQKMSELLDIAEREGFRVYVRTILQDKTYNTTLELYLPYQNFTNRYLILKGPLIYFQGKLYSKDNSDITRYIVITPYDGEDEFYAYKIFETKQLYVFSFENRSKAEKYGGVISDRCVLNSTVDYKKDYVYKLDIGAIYVNRSFNDTNTIYKDYPVISCDVSYVDHPVEDADKVVTQYRMLLINRFGVTYIYNTTELNFSYKLPVRYTISGNLLIDYEIG